MRTTTNSNGWHSIETDVPSRLCAEGEPDVVAMREVLQQLFEATPDMIVIAAPDSRVLHLNTAAREHLGLSPEDDLRSAMFPPTEVDGFMPKEGASAAIRDGRWRGESVIGGHDGRGTQVSLVLLAHRDARGQVRYLSSTAREDVSDPMGTEVSLRAQNEDLERRIRERTEHVESLNADLRRRADQLQRLALQLSAAEDRERQRLATILHDDLQQLLVGARFRLGLLADRTLGDDQLRDGIEQVEKVLSESIEKSRSLSHELSPPALRECGLLSALRWLGEQIEEKFGLNVAVEAHVEAEPFFEPLKIILFRAVQEMLFNVIKHAGVTQARVEARRVGGCVEVTVVDEGKGFDPGQLWTSADSARGHGLFSIQERIRVLGGELTIESAPGRGSRFLLSVPDQDPDHSEPNGGGQPDGRPETRPPRAGLERQTNGDGHCRLTLLLVDDHRVMREGLRALLMDQPDIEVIGAAEDGKEAVALVQALAPDVVIMDVSMPVMNGIDATRVIKREWPDTRVIGLSMHDRPDVRQDMFDAGVDAYLSKAGPSHELLAAIRHR